MLVALKYITAQGDNFHNKHSIQSTHHPANCTASHQIRINTANPRDQCEITSDTCFRPPVLTPLPGFRAAGSDCRIFTTSLFSLCPHSQEGRGATLWTASPGETCRQEVREHPRSSWCSRKQKAKKQHIVQVKRARKAGQKLERIKGLFRGSMFANSNV